MVTLIAQLGTDGEGSDTIIDNFIAYLAATYAELVVPYQTAITNAALHYTEIVVPRC